MSQDLEQFARVGVADCGMGLVLVIVVFVLGIEFAVVAGVGAGATRTIAGGIEPSTSIPSLPGPMDSMTSGENTSWT